MDEILASDRRISARYENMVVRIGEHFAVKYGDKPALLQEGENMLFVAQSSSVPVPTGYAIFHDEDSNKYFLIQEYIPGYHLDKVWGKLSTERKRNIAAQLRRHMDELRSIPASGYYGGLWRQPTPNYHFADGDLMDHPHPDPAISGPQDTEEQWTEAMWRCLDARVIEPFGRKQLPQLRRVYHSIFEGHSPVFTDANFLGRNIMLRKDEKDDTVVAEDKAVVGKDSAVDGKDDTVVIIDWEHSGWYPTYWEYCCAMIVCKYSDDWAEWVREMLEEYFPEHGWMICHRTFVSQCT
jgi:hypothetical protein